MKHLKNTTLVLAFFSLVFLFSCKKDEETKTNLKEVKFSFDTSNPPINQELISNLSSASDANASRVGFSLASANLMTAWMSFFQAPASTEAKESNVPIGTCGGDAFVSTYSYDVGAASPVILGYQICETSDKYTFQLLVSEDGSKFVKFLSAEESKTELKQGFMELFGSSIGDESTSSSAVLKYTWKESADGSFEFGINGFDSSSSTTSIKINKDTSGSMQMTEDGKLSYKATWNADGTSGTYESYDSSGKLIDSGNWSN